jgi:hypothetical protein
MSESTLTTSASSVSPHNSAPSGASDLRMLAQVEKWMAMIREVSREQQSGPAFQR